MVTAVPRAQRGGGKGLIGREGYRPTRDHQGRRVLSRARRGRGKDSRVSYWEELGKTKNGKLRPKWGIEDFPCRH